MANKTMHLEREVGGGVACCSKNVPSTWHRTSRREQVTCSRCNIVARMADRKLSSAGERSND